MDQHQSFQNSSPQIVLGGGDECTGKIGRLSNSVLEITVGQTVEWKDISVEIRVSKRKESPWYQKFNKIKKR